MTAVPNASVTSTTLQLGDRTIVVETTPLAKSSPNRLGTVVDQPSPKTLDLKRPRFFRGVIVCLGLAFLLGTAGVPILPLFYSMRWENALLLICVGLGLLWCVALPIVGILWMIFGCRPSAVFDSTTRTARVQTLKRGRRMLPGSVVALQLLPGRADEDFEENRPSFQLNLILDDPKVSRVGFITYREAEWTRAAARELADYLGVPLVDQLPKDIE